MHCANFSRHLCNTARCFGLAVTGITKNRQADVLRESMKRAAEAVSAKKPSPRHIWLLPKSELERISRVSKMGNGGYIYMRYQRAYAQEAARGDFYSQLNTHGYNPIEPS